MRSLRALRLFLVIILCVLVLDQLTKAFILVSFDLYQTVEIIPGLFNITHIRNPGVVFGIFSNGGIGKVIILSLISVVAVIFIGYMYVRTPDKLTRVAFSLIAGGALGNLIDRVRYHEVVDFLDFYIVNYHWPAFNVADSAITIGVVVLLFRSFMQVTPHER